jgi:beta,beta-carotene 9',10'-dioxygenase
VNSPAAASPISGSGPLAGYDSLEDEVVVDSLPVDGTLPAWLRGSLLRNGPALFEDGVRSVRHWFDGQAMLHRFTVSDDGVGYANRFLRTKAYRAMRDGKLAYSEFATDPCRSIFKRAMTVFDPGVTDNAVVNLTKLGRRHYAMTEAPISVEFDPETLETLGYGPKVPGTFATAHPHHEPESGALINVSTRFGPRNAYRFFRQGLDSKPLVLFSESVGKPGYVHSFAMSDRYIVHTEFPFVINPIEIPLKGKPFIESFRWEPERGTRILVWDRRSGEKVATFETDAGFAFHHVGAWEDGDQLTIEYVDHGTPAVIDALYLDRLRSGGDGAAADRVQPRLRRVELDLRRRTLRSRLQSDQGIELPRINENFYLRRYRYVYGIATAPQSTYDAADQLVKLDNESGGAVLWSEPGCYPGEPIFVPEPDADREDTGVVMSVVLDSRCGQSFLLVLDAASFGELGRAYAPHVIPHGIHGAFYEATSGPDGEGGAPT